MTARVEVDPALVSCSVRYALGRHSYLPGLVADEVRRTWPELGEQRTVIREDIARWLEQMGTSDYVMGAGWSTARPTWEQLLRWIDTRNASDVKDACPRCGSTKPSRRFSSTTAERIVGTAGTSLPWTPRRAEMSSDRTPADVIAAAFSVGRGVTNSPEALAARVLDALAAAGFRVVPEPDDTTRAEIVRWFQALKTAEGPTNDQDDRMADLLAAAYLSGDREERPAQCPECGSDDPATRLPVKRPEVHIEGGARVCRFCNRTLTFNFMRNDGGDCDCARAVEDAACSGSWHDVEVSR